jgi:hypothetical protein
MKLKTRHVDGGCECWWSSEGRRSKTKQFDTKASTVVPDQSTGLAQPCLTSACRWERVCSRCYDRTMTLRQFTTYQNPTASRPNPIIYITLQGFLSPNLRQPSTIYSQQTCVYHTQNTSNTNHKQQYSQTTHDDRLHLDQCDTPNPKYSRVYSSEYTPSFAFCCTTILTIQARIWSYSKHFQNVAPIMIQAHRSILHRAWWPSSYGVTLNPIMMGRFLRLHFI